MTPKQIAIVQETAALSHASKIDFREAVRRLVAEGVERYHVDYSRTETTFYNTDGQSLVVPMRLPPHEIAAKFSVEGVAAAVRQSQRGEHTYADFLAKTASAGCVGYFAQLSGRRVIYFGRDGDMHTEHFPAPPEP